MTSQPGWSVNQLDSVLIRQSDTSMDPLLFHLDTQLVCLMGHC